MLLPGKAQQVDINPGRTNAMNPSQPVIAQLLRSPPNDSAIRSSPLFKNQYVERKVYEKN